MPGGFAHGDHIRPGAIAQFSPVMAPVIRAAEDGYPVLGICNGFQVLVETGLLPGALMRNDGLRFLCETVELEVVSTNSVLTAASTSGALLSLPINHYEGNYTCDEETTKRLFAEDQVVSSLRGQPERFDSVDRWSTKYRRQRRWAHATSRTGNGSSARLG